MFNVYSPLAGGNDLGTFRRPNEYPFDFDGSLDFTRPATGISPFPYPQTIGYVSGFAPLQNALEYQLMIGKKYSGPWQGAIPNAASMSAVFPDIQGALRKVRG